MQVFQRNNFIKSVYINSRFHDWFSPFIIFVLQFSCYSFFFSSTFISFFHFPLLLHIPAITLQLCHTYLIAFHFSNCFLIAKPYCLHIVPFNLNVLRFPLVHIPHLIVPFSSYFRPLPVEFRLPFAPGLVLLYAGINTESLRSNDWTLFRY